MAVIGLPAAFIVALVAYLAAGFGDSIDTPARSFTSKGFGVLVLVEIGLLPGVVDFFGGIIAAIGGLL